MALTGEAAGAVHALADGAPRVACKRGHRTAIISGLTFLFVVFAALHAPVRDLALEMLSGLAAVALPLLRRSAEMVQLAGMRAPALALGVGVAALAIPVAMLAGLLRWSLRDSHPAADTRALTPTADQLNDTTGFARPRRAWVEGKLDGAAFHRDLKPGLTRIGRESDNDIAVASSRQLERYHVAIEHTSEHDIYIYDLTNGSKGQVRVNGRRSARRRLRDGDQVTCPGVKFTFRMESA